MARRSILLSVAFAIAALGTAMIILYVQGVDARATEGQQRVEVLTATDVIKVGESVADAQAAGKLEKTDVVRDDMVEGALSSTASIDDQVALDTIYPGQQIMGQQFGDPGSEQTLTIPDDKLAVSVELTDPARVAGFVNPGSWVAMFVSGDPEIYKPDGTTGSCRRTRGSSSRRCRSSVWETLPCRPDHHRGRQADHRADPAHDPDPAVDQEQAERVIYAARNGDLSFALRTEKSKSHQQPRRHGERHHARDVPGPAMTTVVEQDPVLAEADALRSAPPSRSWPRWTGSRTTWGATRWNWSSCSARRSTTGQPQPSPGATGSCGRLWA